MDNAVNLGLTPMFLGKFEIFIAALVDPLLHHGSADTPVEPT
jgi:hypothetical protein